MTTRTSARRGTFARKQKKYVIDSDSEDDEDTSTTSRQPKFGGILATLKNDENTRRTTRSNTRKKSVLTSPPLKKQSVAADENGRTPPPGSIKVKRSAMRAISPLTTQKPKSRGRKKVDDSYSDESSVDSFASDDEDDETRPQSSADSQPSEQDEDSFQDSESSSEYEFGVDDEEFMPDEDDDAEDDDESSAMSDFIVDDVSEERLYKNFNNSPESKTESVDDDEDDIFNASPSKSLPKTKTEAIGDDEDDIFNASPRSDAESESSDEDIDANIDEDDCVGTECASFAFGDVQSHAADDNDDNNTEMVEETPSKPALRPKTLDFSSPEPMLAMVVDPDEDSDDDGDVLFATIVNSDSGDGDTVVLTFDEDEAINEERSDQIDAQQTIQNSPLIKNQSTDAQETLQNSPVSQGHLDVETPQKLPSSSISTQRQSCNDKTPNDKTQRNSPEQVDAKPPLSAKKKTKKQGQKKYRQEGEVKRGKWALGAKIGVGSFGTVHVGMNKKTGTLMAVKKFKMEGAIMEDIRTEVELMRSLQHTNIVRYLGAQMDDEFLHIFQEWVPGGSVASLLSKFGAFSIEVIQSYISQTLEGLNYLHDNDIMHRDIKGSNILVNDEGIVKLADFGASKKLKNLASNMMMSLTVRGTPYFMAPEVFEEKYSAKADIWGIGCVAFQMVTSLPPWKELGFTNPISLFNHIKKHKGAPIMEHPERDSFSRREESSWILLQEFVNRCFEQDPSQRPSVKELLNDPFISTPLETLHEDDESTHYPGLFSPGAERLHLFSPKQLSLSAKRRTKSNDRRGTLSPAHPKKTRPSFTLNSTPPAMKSNIESSPSPDASGWPAWAKYQLELQNKEAKDNDNISQLMDSLALSEDSTDIDRRRSNISTYSNLAGLNFLESTGSNSTN